MSDTNGGLSVNYGQVDFVCRALQGIINALQAANRVLQREIYRLNIGVFNPVTQEYEIDKNLIKSLRTQIENNESQIAQLNSLIQDLQNFKDNVKQTDNELAAMFMGICNNIIPRPIPGMPTSDYIKYLNNTIDKDVLFKSMIKKLSEIKSSEKTNDAIKKILDTYMMKKYATKLYGISPEEALALIDAQLTYNMFGKKYNGTHRGVDIYLKPGAPLYSIVSGKIIAIKEGSPSIAPDSDNYSCVTIEIDDPFNPGSKINVMFLHLNIKESFIKTVKSQYNIDEKENLDSLNLYKLKTPIDIKAGDELGDEFTRGLGGYHTHIEFNSTLTKPQSPKGPTPTGVLNADEYLAKIVIP